MLQTSQACEPHHNNCEVLDPSSARQMSSMGAELCSAPQRTQLIQSMWRSCRISPPSFLSAETIVYCSGKLPGFLSISLRGVQRGSCDSLFQLYIYWKLENIHCHPSHLPAACLCCLLLTDPNKIPRNWGRWKEHQLCEVPGTVGATRPADSLLGFLTQKLSEKLHLFTQSRNRQRIFSQFSNQTQQWHTHQTKGEETASRI